MDVDEAPAVILVPVGGVEGVSRLPILVRDAVAGLAALEFSSDDPIQSTAGSGFVQIKFWVGE